MIARVPARRRALCALVCALAVAVCGTAASAPARGAPPSSGISALSGLPPGIAPASGVPVDMAAPYEYLGWGEPQPPVSVMSETGIRDITLAFVLSHGTCNPEWDGQRPLLGGSDAQAIAAIRAAGGEVVASFGGWSGSKLGVSCKTPAALAAAYQKVVADYGLQAIDIDIEHTEISGAAVRKRVVAALAMLQREDPALEISLTLGVGEGGPEPAGLSLIADAAAIGFQPTVWTGMPFDFGRPLTDMGHASIRAALALAADLVSRYGISEAQALEHTGISSMNGRTDEASETVTVADYETMLAFAREVDLGRMSFWSVNRDRPCPAGDPGAECSGIAQTPYAFTDLLAGYQG